LGLCWQVVHRIMGVMVLMTSLTTIMTTDIMDIPIIITVMSGANTIEVVMNGENMVTIMKEENNITDKHNPQFPLFLNR
jgi:hypothetical protein